MAQLFLRDESGAVTVDWVTLCAASVGVVIATAAVIGVAVGDRADGIAADIGIWRGGVMASGPANAAGHAALRDAFAALTLRELDTVAGYANMRRYAGIARCAARGSGGGGR